MSQWSDPRDRRTTRPFFCCRYSAWRNASALTPGRVVMNLASAQVQPAGLFGRIEEFGQGAESWHGGLSAFA